MSVARPARCLLCAAHPPRPRTASLRPFHSSTVRPARRRPRYPNVKQSDLEALKTRTNEAFPRRTPEDVAAFESKYTPAQLAAIEAAEKSIPSKDLYNQGAHRKDSWRLPYLDDLSSIDPVIDKVRTKSGDEPPRSELTTQRPNRPGDLDPDPIMANLQALRRGKSMDEMEKLSFADIFNAISDPAALVKSQWRDQPSGLAPPIPKLPKDEDAPQLQDDEADPHMDRLCLQTGFTRQQIRQFRIKDLVTHRVVNQTRMGKVQSIYTLAVAGDGNGMLGIGEGKATEGADAMRKARAAAIRNMKPVMRYEGRTIFGHLEGKSGAVELWLSARPPGESA